MKTIVSVQMNTYDAPEEGSGGKGHLKIEIAPGHGIEELDQLLHKLGQARAAQQPPVFQADPQPGQALEAIEDPRVVASVALDGLPMLSLRHPGFGWLHFHLTTNSAGYLVQHMQMALEATMAPPGVAQ